MGRPTRTDFDGACHHIIVKGINNSYIFQNDIDKDAYLMFIERYREKHDIKLFGYCIMDNHAHLFIQSGKPQKEGAICISDYMHDVQCGFGKWRNHHYHRTGPVFNSRFTSFHCTTLPYFVQLIDYIHRNPYKHHKTKTYNYKYSSYENYMTGEGICDLAACYDFLGMTRAELLGHLANYKNGNNFPFLERLINKLRNNPDNQQLEALLLELAFRFEDIRGSRLMRYLDRVQRELMKELVDMKAMSVRAIGKLFNVSTSYVYKQLNTT